MANKLTSASLSTGMKLRRWHVTFGLAIVTFLTDCNYVEAAYTGRFFMSQPYGVVGQRINLTCSMTKASNLTDMIEFRRNPSPGEPTVRVYQDKSKCFPHNKKPLPPRYKNLFKVTIKMYRTFTVNALESPLPPLYGQLFVMFYKHQPTDSVTHTMTSVSPVVETRNSSFWDQVLCSGGTNVSGAAIKNYTLTINPLRLEDGGRWWCQLGVKAISYDVVHLKLHMTPAAGVVGNIQFRQKSSSGPFRTVGELEQTESGCRVISSHLRGYYTKCGNGTHTFNSDVKVYSFISPTLTTDDVTDWKCIMGDVKSNIVTLKLPVNGQWSPWITGESGECSELCVSRTPLTRTCTSPPPSPRGQPCRGRNATTVTEKCTGERCGNGLWSPWVNNITGPCNKLCVRRVVSTRSCTNPPPSPGGRPCNGSSSQNVTQACTGDQCVKGQWSSWTVETHGNCTGHCTRTVVLVRSCTDPPPSPGAPPCEGSNMTSITEACTGGQCIKGQWSSWTVETHGNCTGHCTRTVVLVRSCTDPPPSPGAPPCEGSNMTSITEACTDGQCINGQWSSWTSDTPGLCDNTCVRKLDFARTCSKPPPSPGGKECKGIEVKVTTEACMGGKCLSSLPFEMKTGFIAVIITSTLVAFAVIAVLCVYLRKKAIKRKHEQVEEEVLAEENEYWGIQGSGGKREIEPKMSTEQTDLVLGIEEQEYIASTEHDNPHAEYEDTQYEQSTKNGVLDMK